MLAEQARHIVFFVNCIAWDRSRRGLRPLEQNIAALAGYVGAVARRVSYATEISDVLRTLTPATFLRACILENDRYMAQFDPRLLRPRVVPALGKLGLLVAEAIELAQPARPSTTAPRQA